MITNLLANVSWKTKIFAFAGLFLFGIIVEAALGGYTILKQNSAMRQALEGSRAKVNAAITARAAILEMSRSQADLISQSNPQAIRAAAIAAIRASSVLDCAPESDAIERSIHAALQMDCANVENPYGDGYSADRIVAALKSAPEPRQLIRKRFVDA